METLEVRCLLDANQWLMVFRDLSLGTTLDDQALAAQQFLYDQGIEDISVVRAEDLEGTFIVQTADDVTEDALFAELQGLPGFAAVERDDGSQAPTGTFDPGPPLDGLVPAPSDDSTPPPGSFNTTSLAPAALGHMILLCNGTVMAQGSGISKTWYQLTPDINGNYANGTWSALPSMGLERKDYGSNVLPSGKVLIVGGEYSGPSGVKNVINSGEIYDPVANSWSSITNFPQNAFGDDPTVILPDGRVLAGYIFDARTYIYNPANNTWSQTGTKLRGDRSDEESWVKLPDGSVLSYDIWASPDGGPSFSQRYVPGTSSWVDAGSVPVPLSGSSVDHELGPGLQLPDGRIFLVGATNNTAIYNPTTNSWTAGPTLPSGLGADDTPAAALPNGHIIFAVDTSIPNFTGPTRLFDFDPNAPIASSLTELTGQPGFPSQLTSDLDHAAFTTRMLVLPSGQILFNPGQSSRIWIYTPDGAPSDSWRPTITSVVNNGGGTYTLTGTQLNGFSEGAAYGDDAEMSSNYPIVQLKNNATGNIFYARTFNWSLTGIATGSTPETTQFTLPPALPAGSYSISVIANGIASAPAAFTINALYWDPLHTHAATGSGGTGTWNTTAANWFNGTTDVVWNNSNNDTAMFAGSSGGTVTIGAGITARAIGFSTGGYSLQSNVLTLSGGGVDVANGLTETISSQIAGAAGLTLTGSGTTILTGTNTYSGNTTISAGTLQVGSGGTAGSLGTGSIIDNSALRYNRSDSITIASAISGNGSLTQAGTGTLTLTAANSYSGITTISSGTLQVGNGGAGATLGTGNVTDNSALQFNHSDSITVPNVISGTGTLTQAGTGTLIFTGANSYSGSTTISAGTLQLGTGGSVVTLGTGSIIDNGALVINRAGTLTLPNVISGTGSMSLIGSGTIILTAADSYSGATTISSGTLQVGTGGSTVTLGTGPIVNNSALVFNRGGSLTVSNLISGTGSLSLIGPGTIFLTGPDTYSGTTTISSGTLQVGTGGSTVTFGTGPIVNNSALVINRGGTLALANVISGTGTLTKSGAGTITLSNPANTYTGATTVTAGTLSVTGNIAPSPTTVTGGILAGTGTTGDVTVNAGGTLAPGLSPGTIQMGNLALGSGSNYSVELNGSATSGAFDQTIVSGTVTLGGNLLLTGTRTDTTADVFTIIDNDGTDPVSGTFAGLPEGSVVQLNSVMYSLSYQGGTGNDVTLTSIPAPRVVACSVAPGAILAPGSISIQVTFSKPMKVANLDPSDFSLQGVFHGQIYSINSFGFSPDGTVLTLNYVGQPDDAFTFTLVAGANGGTNFTDLLGNALDGEFSGTFPSGNGVAGGNFVLNFSKDLDTEPYPVPLTSVAPPGGLIYDPSVQRVIAFAGDTDSYTFAVDAGQTISVLVNQANGGLRPSVVLRDPANNLLASASTSTNLQPVFLSAIPATTSGTYTVTVSGSNANRGIYVLQIFLNAALEAENNSGPTNDTTATAQNIDNSFVALTTSNASASRGAVLGGNAASATWNDYYSFTVAANTQISGVLSQLTGSGVSLTIEDGAGNVLGTGASGATNYDLGTGSFSIAGGGTYYVHVSGAAAATYSLVLTKNAVFDKEGNDTFSAAQDITGAAGVLGAVGMRSGAAAGSAFAPGNLANVEGSSSSSIPFGQASSRYQQIYSASQFSSPEIIDAIRFRRDKDQAPGSITGLTVQVDLAYAATNVATASGTFANNIGGGKVTVYNGPLTLVSNGAGSPNPFDVVIDVDNTFYYNPALGDLLLDVRVTAPAGTNFLLDAASSGQQSITTRVYNFNVTNQGGNVGGSTDSTPFGLITKFDFVNPTPNDDWYSLNITNAAPNLRLQTSTPSDGPNQFLNTLNPRLELYDPAGNLVASGTTLPDGHNESIQFHAPGLNPGAYRVRVTGENATWGEYFLGSTTVANQSPVAGDDSVSTNEDTAVTINVLANDTDADGYVDQTSVAITSGPARGMASVNTATGQITYTPGSNYSGSDSFSYTIKDDNGAISNVAVVNLSITAIADPPTLAVSDATGSEGQATSLNIAAALTDTDGSESLSIQIAGVPATAYLSAGTNNGDGTWTLAPADLNGLRITVADEGSYSLTVSATSTETSNGDTAITAKGLLLSVLDVTPSVSAVSRAVSASEDASATNSGSFGDYDDAVTITASSGTVTQSGTQSGTWNWSGTGDEDHPYTVTITATNIDGSTATTSFAVSFTDIPPTLTAASNSISAAENVSATNSGSFGDYDDAVTITASSGMVTQSGAQSGTWMWSGTGDEDHPYSVTITATNADGSAASTSFAVSFTDVSPTVAAANSVVTINEGQTATNTGTFADYDDAVTLTVNDGQVTQTGTTSGTWSWSNYYGDNGSHTIVVTATNADGSRTMTSFTVNVNNVAPTATPNQYSTSQAISVAGNAITDNTGSGADSDPAGANDPLTISGHTDPANGTLVINANGSFTYTPDSTFSGTDSFTYTISDGDGGYATATVTIIVTAAVPGSILTIPDSCLGGTALLVTGTAANDTIIVEPGSSSSTLKVTINGVSTTVARPSSRIIVTGGAGDDNIQIAGAVANPVWLYGEAGNDRLNAGNGGSLLIGGDGNDQLLGGGGRDVMIGGEGADNLVGNSDDDILIAGLTDEDSRTSAGHDEFWCQVLHEWNSGDSFAQRVQTLRPILLPVVHDDHYADAVDFLNGASGNDWLIFMNGEDHVAGQAEATN